MTSFNVLKAINILFDIIMASAITAAVCFLSIYFITKWVKREGGAKGLFLGIVFLLFEAFVAGFIIFIPQLIYIFSNTLIPAGLSRWLLTAIILSLAIYFYTRKESGKRGLFTAILHMSILIYGWLVGGWVGIFCMAVPIFAIFYWLLYHLAIIILPASDPENQKENLQKFTYLCLYLWGLQYPAWVVPDGVSRTAEQRIKGDFFKDIGQPGMVWTNSHQVVGVSTGIEFVDIKGPGLIFTKTYERPGAVVDLRTQLRSSVIQVVLNDGTQIHAVVFASFAIDRRNRISKDQRLAALRVGPHLLGSEDRIDKTAGNYSYSSARVRVALSAAGVSPVVDNGAIKHTVVHWDEWVMQQIEQAAREALSQRSMDDIWVPLDDRPGRSAMDEVSHAMQNTVGPKLQNYGIQLFSCRVVRFNFDAGSKVPEQQFKTWKTIWDQRMAAKMAVGDAEYERLLMEAKAKARSFFLNTVIGSLQTINEKKPRVAKQILALEYIDKLEKFMQNLPGDAQSQALKEQIESHKMDIASKQGEDEEED